MTRRPHSAEFLGDARDHWWNEDFVELLARRFELGRVASLLDVGCGVGHFSRVLARHLAPGARVTGVDREPRWVAEAHVRFEAEFPGRGRFMQGDAGRLPFAAASFDAVACQTVLMHLDGPRGAIAEMVRVVRPGGVVIAAEPNNLFGCLDWNGRTSERPTSEIVDVFTMWLAIQRGQQALGLGDHTIGERLPGLFAEAGLHDVRVSLNNRAAVMLPPYDTPAQATQLAAARAWRAEGEGPWDVDRLRTCFEAGQGPPGLLDRALGHIHRWWQEDEEARRAGTYSAAGGAVFYVVAGRRPA